MGAWLWKSIYRILGEPTRYMGTFNDPNQYAFYLFCMILLISLYACNYGDRTAPIYYCLGVFFHEYIQIHGHFFQV